MKYLPYRSFGNLDKDVKKHELVAVEYGKDIYDVTDALIKAAADDLAGLSEYEKYETAAFAPERTKDFRKTKRYAYEMTGIVYPTHADKNILIDFGIVEEAGSGMSREEPYYIPMPEIYGRRKLNALYREIPLKDATSRLLRKYFNAAANLYGIIPLHKLYGIIASQNKSLVTREEFLAFAEIARHECEDYYILGKSELYYDGPETELMEYEVIDVQLIDEDLDPYHEVLRGHQGKPYYVPDKKELLAYDNPFYWENTPEAEAFRTFLLTKTTVPEDKMEAVFVDIYYGLHCMNAGLEDVLNRLDEIGVEFRRKVDVGDFAEVYTPFHNHVRMQCNRGHTPDELFALLPPEERIPKSLSFGPNIRQAIADGTMNPEELRQGILTMDMPSEELRMSLLKEIAAAQTAAKPKKVGRNDPCPCGSGKKFKKCCGR